MPLSDIAVYDLAKLVAEVVGFTGEIVRDTSKPNGTPRKLMSADRLRALGWAPTIALRDGVERVYRAFSALGSQIFCEASTIDSWVTTPPPVGPQGA